MTMGRDRLTDFINAYGRSVKILRDSGNISEMFAIAQMNQNTQGGGSMMLDSYQEVFFRWDSDIRLGDIIQDQMSMDRHLLLSLQKVGILNDHAGFKASTVRSNDAFVLGHIAQSAPDAYGHSTYTLQVKLNDYCHVSHWTRGDNLTEIGEAEKSEIFVIFSARKLSGYVPVAGDQCQLGNGSGAKFQIDSIDDHVFPGCYRVLCSPDVRI